jgi:hypothetical protein
MMRDNERVERFSPNASEEDKRVLSELAESMNEHISALQALGRAYLARKSEYDPHAPTRVLINIGVGPNSELFDEKLSCLSTTLTYICGKGESGYIYCQRDVLICTAPLS